MKRHVYSLNKGIVFILSFLMLGLVFNSCEKTYDEAVTSELSLKNHHMMVDPCKEVCLVAGQHMYVGNVTVGEDGGDIYVTFNITEPDVYLLETHVDIFLTEAQFKADKKISNGGAIPGKFEFKKSWSMGEMMTSYTVMIPASYVDEVTDGANCFFIATHAALSNGETAWGGVCDETDKGVSLGNAMQFPGRNWSVYFEFCLDECETTIDFTYAWEDLNVDGQEGVDGNDGDYNDLVIKSDVIKTMSELKISFYASARGASYDHAFKIRIPKMGIVDGMNGVFGEEAISEDGDDYIITVFASTKAHLPQENINPYPFAANTVRTDTDCEPHATAEITISIDGDFDFDPNEPYYPFITVHPGTANAYDLNIWELDMPNGDTWKDVGGIEYPNGIIISDDWKWPYEKTHITAAYSGFKSITEGWEPNWATLTGPSEVFDVVCE